MTDSAAKAGLKPCPEQGCTGEEVRAFPRSNSTWQIECTDHGWSGPVCATKELAYRIWNRRAAEATDPEGVAPEHAHLLKFYAVTNYKDMVTIMEGQIARLQERLPRDDRQPRNPRFA